MTRSSTTGRRGTRAAAALTAASATVALLLAGMPAHAADPGEQSYMGTVTTATTSEDLQLQEMRYVFEEDGVEIPVGPNAVPGVAGPAGSSSWQTTTVGAPLTRMTGRIVDLGTAADFWVRIEAWMKTDDEFYGSSCRFYRGDPDAGGVLLDDATQSPYQCAASDYTVDYDLGEVVSQGFTVSSLNWATVRGAITPQGSVSLREGHLESPSTRFITDGRWYPADPAAQQPFLTIAPGATLDWAAYRRNGESDQNASGYFSYRIYDGGAPTRFWVSGMASNWRGVEFNWDYTCQIFDGDPLQGASAVDHSPYSCDMTTTEVSGRGDYRVDFTIRTAEIQTLGPLEARDLMSAGCGDAADACYFVPATNDALVEPGTPLGPPYSNDGEDDAEYQFSYASGRSITNTVNVSASAEANVLDLFKVAIKVAYGWEETDETDKKWIATMIVPAHEQGWFEFAPAYRRISGDFLFETGGTWYRVTGGTFTVPDSTVPGTLTSHTRAISDGVEAEPPVTPTPATPAPTPTSRTMPAAASGALAATGSSVDPSVTARLAGIAVLVGAALLVTGFARRGRRTTD